MICLDRLFDRSTSKKPLKGTVERSIRKICFSFETFNKQKRVVGKKAKRRRRERETTLLKLLSKLVAIT